MGWTGKAMRLKNRLPTRKSKVKTKTARPLTFQLIEDGTKRSKIDLVDSAGIPTTEKLGIKCNL